MAAEADRRPFFLERDGPRLFFLHFPARAARRGGAVFFAPFAEEMNRGRRMTALLGEALAAAGVDLLVFDGAGTGDSAGAFGDARWEGWIEDGAASVDWLARKTGSPVAVMGLRTGAALALAAARMRPDDVSRAVLWQPVPSGQLFLTQFLRLRLAAAMAGGDAGETTAGLRERLAAGETLEIGGYALAPAMAAALDGMRLADLAPPPGCPVAWLEVAPTEVPQLAPAARPVIDAWRTAGVAVAAEAVTGPQFWAIQEITTAPALIEATVRHLVEAAP